MVLIDRVRKNYLLLGHALLGHALLGHELLGFGLLNLGHLRPTLVLSAIGAPHHNDHILAIAPKALALGSHGKGFGLALGLV